LKLINHRKMKKILILIIGVLFLWNVALAQAPTLNFRINNPRIEQITSGTLKSFLCFDVEVCASTGGTYFDGIQTVLTFNTSGLDASNALNRKIIKGPLATGDDGAGTFFYNISQNWVPATSRLFVGIASDPAWANLPGNSGVFNEVTTSYQTLVTIKISITNKSLIANLVFVPGSMNGTSTYRDFSGVPQLYANPNSYGSHDLANAYLGRIFSSGSGWSQAGNTVAGTGWTNWATSENTTVWDGNGHITNANSLVTGLYVDPSAILTIDPAQSLTASGASYFSDNHSLVLASTLAGTGSFIDNGTITYGASGSADVQTYIKNSASPGSYYAHLVGPTIDDPATGFSGVYLQAFDLPGNTYAYEYLEPSNTWSNISLLTDPVPSTKGILLSTVVPTDNTMTMTGQLITGAVASAALQNGGTNNLDLLSNPYPSSLDFNGFYTTNSSKITNKYYLWNPTGGAGTGNYVWYIISGGGTLPQYIQVGQGFFVETTSNTSANYNNTMRVHSTVPFLKDDYAYQLRLNLEGNGFSDAAFIYFKEEGTWGYDELHDVNKWWSMLPEATELWAVGDDGSMLSMNSIPPLGSNMVSVPMGFKCGADASYKITAENVGSFDAGTQIFLEDKVTGGAWHDLVANPVYEFSATPAGESSRFVVHFFGPTGINDPVALKNIQIYGYGHDAYIVNRGTETVEDYFAYDMMGREIQRGTLPNNSVNIVTIGDASAYYVVKVITKEGHIYTDKVYINK
jgi:hypothetical protein